MLAALDLRRAVVPGPVRTREIGLRVAIGATPRMVAAMVLRQAVTWTLAGAAMGIVLATAVTRFLGTFLYGISPTDPWVFAGVILLLSLVAFTAALACPHGAPAVSIRSQRYEQLDRDRVAAGGAVAVLVCDGGTILSSGNRSCLRRRSVVPWPGRAGRLPSADRTSST